MGRGNYSDIVNCVGRMAVEECEPSMLKAFITEALFIMIHLAFKAP